MVQIFQRESIFCSKISSGGSLFIKKLVPGGTNFGGSIFTMTYILSMIISNCLAARDVQVRVRTRTLLHAQDES